MPGDSKNAWRRAAERALAGALTVLALVGPAAAQDDAAKIVTKTAQGYSLDANESNVVQVLTEVGQHAGFVVEAPDNFHSPLTVNLQDVPLDQLLRRVLRNENYIIVYRGGVQKTSISGDKIDKIFLLSQAAGPATRPPGAGSPLAGPGGHGAPGGPPGHNAPPPPPNEQEGGDVATRSAQARARAEARRAALAGTPPSGAPGAPVGPGGMPEAARMVQSPEDFTPPPIDEAEAPHDVPAVDVPPPDEGGDEE